jgi:transposase, IS5 family
MTRSQPTLASTGFEKYTKVTRRAQFLAEMDRVVPWRELCARIEPVYPQPGNGRPPVGVERMLRMYFLQHWFNLSDPAVEEALYDTGSAGSWHIQAFRSVIWDDWRKP